MYFFSQKQFKTVNVISKINLDDMENPKAIKNFDAAK